MFTWSWSCARMEYGSPIFCENETDEAEHDGPAETSEAV
jgi:hypothetical protein